MKTAFHGFTSVRQKLFLGALLASLVALLIAGASLFLYDQRDFRQSRSSGVAIEAALVGHASTAALQFEDPVVAAENLGFLRARPSVRAAAIYGPGGAIFADYTRPGVGRDEIPAGPGAPGVAIEGDLISIFEPIKVGRDTVGVVYLVEDLGIGTRVASYFAIALAVLIAALGVSALLSTWFQRGITEPIGEVAKLAHHVVEKQDYTVRATKTTRDEIGTLVDAFNEMLSVIERRTLDLEALNTEVGRLNADLEQRVKERTAQLEESNLQLQTANLAKSSFLSMMSHEIRTPMNGALGMLELLSLSKLDTQQRATLGIVRDSGQSLLRIIDDILDFSKIEAGKLEVRPEVASVARVIDSVTAIYTGNASSKGLLLQSSCDPAISPAVLVDPLRLQQILNNLVSNAIKFTSKGFIEVRAELAERRESTDVVRISVTDTGVGMSAEGLARLFQPFSQVGRAHTGGTGLGLSIGQRLAGLMGGAITMSSRQGHGTVATVTLPLPVADPANLPRIDSHETPAPALAGRRKPPTLEQAREEGTLVLVADDHPVNRILLARQVGVLGYACVTASDGREALAHWETGQFGLILTDCNMPEMDGYQLSQEIRRREQGGPGPATLIIACTANALAGDAARCFAAGMDDYIAKPVDLGKLAGKLDRWLPIPGAAAAPANAAPAPANEVVVDRSVMAELSGGEPELERDVLRDLVKVNAEDLATLDDAFTRRDSDLVVNTAHRIKGANRGVGAMALGDASARLEEAARAGDWNAAGVMRSELRAQADRLAAHVAALQEPS